MKHLFVSYETAKALKEFGFDEPCFTYWYEDFYNKGKLNPIEDDWINSTNGDTFLESKNCTAPTHQQVIDWLFDRHQLNVSIFPMSKNQWVYEISFMETYPENYKDGHYYSGVDFKQITDQLLFKENKGIKLPELDEMAANNYGRYEALNAAIDEAIKLIKTK